MQHCPKRRHPTYIWPTWVLVSAKLNRRDIKVVKARLCKNRFHAGEVIHISGIYRVFHLDHRVHHDVTLVKDERFPPCTQCSEKVYFELVREVAAIDEDYDFKVRLFQIPHPATEDAQSKKSA